MRIDNIKHRWTPTPREDFHEKEYVRCDGLRVALAPNPATADPWSELSWPPGMVWSTEAGRCVVVEAQKRNRQVPTNFWKEVHKNCLIDAPGGPWMWLGFLDAHVPLQPVDLVVVREFKQQTVRQLQQLRQDGWTFLHISAPRDVDIHTSGPGTSPTNTRGTMGGTFGLYTVLAERVEKVVPT